MKKIEKLKGMHYSAAHPVIIEKINEIIDYLNMDSPDQVSFEELGKVCEKQVVGQELTEFEKALIDTYMNNTPIIQQPDKRLSIARKQFIDAVCRRLKKSIFKND